MGQDAEALAREAATRLARRTTGAVVGVINGVDEAVAGAGHTRLPNTGPPTTNTLLDIGSITKVFTCLAVAEQVLSGDLALDTEVGRVIPQLRDVPITVEQLCTHTSGLPRSPIGMLAELRHNDPYSAITAQQVIATAASARLRQPGRLRYSNLGVSLLALVAQAVADVHDYDSLVSPLLSDLGMPSTRAALTAPDLARLATGYSLRGKEVPDWNLTGMAGCGALRSTVTDMLTFLRAQLAVTTPAIEVSQRIRFHKGRNRVALGWFIMDSAEGPTYWHNGATGGYRCFAAFLPDSQAAVVILTNQYTLRGPDLEGLRVLKRLSA